MSRRPLFFNLVFLFFGLFRRLCRPFPAGTAKGPEERGVPGGRQRPLLAGQVHGECFPALLLLLFQEIYVTKLQIHLDLKNQADPFDRYSDAADE